MAQVKVIRQTPVPPPIKEIQLTLTEHEARRLSALLGSGITGESIDLLGLRDLYSKINNLFPFERLPFKARYILTRGF